MSANRSGIVVTVDDGHLSQIKSVAEKLKQAGMDVEQVMEISGIITGQAPVGSNNDFAQIPGVAAVEVDGEMHAI